MLKTDFFLFRVINIYSHIKKRPLGERRKPSGLKGVYSLSFFVFSLYITVNYGKKLQKNIKKIPKKALFWYFFLYFCCFCIFNGK